MANNFLPSIDLHNFRLIEEPQSFLHLHQNFSDHAHQLLSLVLKVASAEWNWARICAQPCQMTSFLLFQLSQSQMRSLDYDTPINQFEENKARRKRFA